MNIYNLYNAYYDAEWLNKNLMLFIWSNYSYEKYIYSSNGNNLL